MIGAYIRLELSAAKVLSCRPGAEYLFSLWSALQAADRVEQLAHRLLNEPFRPPLPPEDEEEDGLPNWLRQAVVATTGTAFSAAFCSIAACRKSR